MTCEYPPQSGGVSDYTSLVAHRLAEAGDEVHVWAPEIRGQEAVGSRQEAEGRKQKAESSRQQAADGRRQPAGVTVHREFGRFRTRDLRRVGKQLDRFAKPRRLLVQWVPHGYGYRSMNLPFCFWLWQRAKFKGDRIELMVHEPFLAFREGSRKQDLAAVVHRLMVAVLLNASSHIWVANKQWEKVLRPFLLGRVKPFGWLPVPSNIPVIDDPDGIAKVRAKYATNGTRLIGHFGAYNDYMTDIMSKLVPSLLNGDNGLAMLFLGRGSRELRDRLMSVHPALAGRLHATGELPATEISKLVSACDLMLQPYQDGVSGRRTSAMTALDHRIAVVTTFGKATEDCCSASNSVESTAVSSIDEIVKRSLCLLNDETRRRQVAAAGKVLYENTFDITCTITKLRASIEERQPAVDVLLSEANA